MFLFATRHVQMQGWLFVSRVATLFVQFSVSQPRKDGVRSRRVQVIASRNEHGRRRTINTRHCSSSPHLQ